MTSKEFFSEANHSLMNRKEGAVNAFSYLYGRFFAGRTITAKFYDEKAYSEGSLFLPL